MKPSAHRTIFIILLLACALLTYARNAVWSDELSLWGDVVLKSPNGARGNANCGKAYGARGEHEKAVAHHSRAIAFTRNQSELVDEYFNRGNGYFHLGRFEKAIEDYSESISVHERDFREDASLATAYYNRGTAYSRLGLTDSAIEDYSRAIAVDPGYREAYVGRGYAFSQKGLPDKAAEDLRTSLELAK